MLHIFVKFALTRGEIKGESQNFHPLRPKAGKKGVYQFALIAKIKLRPDAEKPEAK